MWFLFFLSLNYFSVQISSRKFLTFWHWFWCCTGEGINQNKIRNVTNDSEGELVSITVSIYHQCLFCFVFISHAGRRISNDVAVYESFVDRLVIFFTDFTAERLVLCLEQRQQQQQQWQTRWQHGKFLYWTDNCILFGLISFMNPPPSLPPYYWWK